MNKSLHQIVIDGQNAVSEIEMVLFPFKFYKFVDHSRPPKQRCKLCDSDIADVFSSLTHHLESKHQIKCPTMELPKQ